MEVGPLKPPRAQARARAPVRDGGYGVIINPKMYKPLYHAKLQKKRNFGIINTPVALMTAQQGIIARF